LDGLQPASTETANQWGYFDNDFLAVGADPCVCPGNGHRVTKGDYPYDNNECRPDIVPFGYCVFQSGSFNGG